MRRKKYRLNFAGIKPNEQGLVEIRLIAEPTYVDLIEFRKVLFHQGVSPGQLMELVIRKVSLRDESVLNLIAEAKREKNRTAEFAVERKKDPEEIYNVIEMALDDQQRQVGGG